MLEMVRKEKDASVYQFDLMKKKLERTEAIAAEYKKNSLGMGTGNGSSSSSSSSSQGRPSKSSDSTFGGALRDHAETADVLRRELKSAQNEVLQSKSREAMIKQSLNEEKDTVRTLEVETQGLKSRMKLLEQSMSTISTDNKQKAEKLTHALSE